MKHWHLLLKKEDLPRGKDIPRARMNLLSIIGNAAYRCLFLMICFLLLAQWDVVTLRTALFVSGFVFLFDVITFSIFIQETVRVVNFLRVLAAHPDERLRPPIVYEGLHQDVLDAGLKLHSGWRAREQRQRDFLFSRERVFDAIPWPMFLLRAPRLVVGANGAAHRFFRRDLIGLDVSAFLRDPDVLDAIQAVAVGASPRSVSWTPPERPVRFFDVSIISLPASEKTAAINVMVGLHDITEIKRLETMRADFVANASHELRTPLASVIGFAETLQTTAKDDPEARKRFLEIMLEQGRRMQRTIDDLLSLSRIELRSHTPPADPVDLGETLDAVTRGLECLAMERGKPFDRRIEPNLPKALGDAHQIAQVFQNVLDNALKYGRAGTAIRISVDLAAAGPTTMPLLRRSPALRVVVANEGDRIGGDDLSRLTERLYRVEKARARGLGGTGLGLAIVKHIMVRHRGALTLDSPSGGGLRVTLYFPVFPATPDEA